MKKVILASASPRRMQILSDLNIEFEVIISNVDESSVNADKIGAEMYVQELALLKANAVANEIIKNNKSGDLIISADTVVCLNGKILGKPNDEEEAFSMISQLSGNLHEVYTGICVMRVKDAFAATEVCKTSVSFKNLTEDKIKSYIKTKEPMDKAGAYGIQGLGATLIKEIHGDYFNVVGLPISTLTDLLEKEFDYYLF